MTILQFLDAGSCSSAWWAGGSFNVCFPVHALGRSKGSGLQPRATQMQPRATQHVKIIGFYQQPKRNPEQPKCNPSATQVLCFLLFSKVCNPSATQCNPAGLHLGCSGLHLGCSGLQLGCCKNTVFSKSSNPAATQSNPEQPKA